MDFITLVRCQRRFLGIQFVQENLGQVGSIRRRTRFTVRQIMHSLQSFAETRGLLDDETRYEMWYNILVMAEEEFGKMLACELAMGR